MLVSREDCVSGAPGGPCSDPLLGRVSIALCVLHLGSEWEGRGHVPFTPAPVSSALF